MQITCSSKTVGEKASIFGIDMTTEDPSNPQLPTGVSPESCTVIRSVWEGLRPRKPPCQLVHLRELQDECVGFFTHWRNLIGLWPESRKRFNHTSHLWLHLSVKEDPLLATQVHVDHLASTQVPLLWWWQHEDRSSPGANDLKLGPVSFHFKRKVI